MEIITMKVLMLFYVLFHFFDFKSGLDKSFVYELYSSNEINGDVISSFDGSSVQECVALCDNTFGCLSVNFHEVTKQCILTDYYPLDFTKSGIPNTGWKIYFRRNFEKSARGFLLTYVTCDQLAQVRVLNIAKGMDLLGGAGAWQSSTFIDIFDSYAIYMEAYKAIDGETATIHDCAHTYNNFSYWAVKFGTPGPVKSVKIMSRTDCCFSPQTNFIVTVANTRDDVINDTGTVCGSYFGPAIDKAPFSVTITCANTIFGRFLKIKHESMGFMVLCEVYVYTP